jgi:hypothetical protein
MTGINTSLLHVQSFGIAQVRKNVRERRATVHRVAALRFNEWDTEAPECFLVPAFERCTSLPDPWAFRGLLGSTPLDDRGQFARRFATIQVNRSEILDVRVRQMIAHGLRDTKSSWKIAG